MPETADIEKKLENFRTHANKDIAEIRPALMETIKANRKDQKNNQLVRSSTAGTDQYIRLKGINNVAMEIEINNMADQESKKKLVRDATTSDKKVLKERAYEDMMDEHALQIFIVRNGKIIEETPEYLSFKRLA